MRAAPLADTPRPPVFGGRALCSTSSSYLHRATPTRPHTGLTCISRLLGASACFRRWAWIARLHAGFFCGLNLLYGSRYVLFYFPEFYQRHLVHKKPSELRLIDHRKLHRVPLHRYHEYLHVGRQVLALQLQWQPVNGSSIYGHTPKGRPYILHRALTVIIPGHDRYHNFRVLPAPSLFNPRPCKARSSALAHLRNPYNARQRGWDNAGTIQLIKICYIR